jgi:sulfatase modifying factor 1
MAPFDPYHIWLGIPEADRPISKYRLLGLADFELDRDVISTAVERQIVFLRMLQAGEHEVLVAQLLNEVSLARVTLLNADEKVVYDEQLRIELTPEPEPAPTQAIETPAPSPIPVAARAPVTPESPVSIVQPVKRPRRKVQKKMLKRPAVRGVLLVTLIGVLVLFISMKFTEDVGPVVRNMSDQISAEIAAGNAAGYKASAEKKDAAVKAAIAEAAKITREEAAAEKAAADKAAAEKAAADKAVLDEARRKAQVAAKIKISEMVKRLEEEAAKKMAAAILARAPITNTIGVKINKIPAGTFTMGSPTDEPFRGGDEHQHKVTITKAFYMQTTEVTQGQWKEVMGTEPWRGKPYVKKGPDYAASYVSWRDAVAYCKKLSEKEGKTYRLPTEAEWEYACRAGTETAWSFGDDEKALGDYAWYRENAANIDEEYAHQVGLKKPNAFGLYDMHGNVYEWCHDRFEEDYYKQSPEKDPTGPTSGSSRVLRGGSWFNVTRGTRSAFRNWYDADDRYHFVGFRLVRELD